MTATLQAAALTEKEAAEEEAAEEDSEFSDTETVFTEGQSQAVSQNGPSQKPTGTSKANSKKGKKRPGASTASDADEARELAEMRKGGFITGEGKKGECLRPSPPTTMPAVRQSIVSTKHAVGRTHLHALERESCND